MPKKTIPSRHMEVHRFFRGLPVIDAIEPLRVVVTKADKTRAHRLDPNNCVFAQACRRLYNSHAVLFLRRTAYVELPDERGRRYVNRFILSHDTNEKIALFDKTGEAPEGGFILNAPSDSQKMNLKRAYTKKYRQGIRKGTRKPTRVALPNKKRVSAMQGVRDGRGKLGINYAF